MSTRGAFAALAPGGGLFAGAGLFGGSALCAVTTETSNIESIASITVCVMHPPMPNRRSYPMLIPEGQPGTGAICFAILRCSVAALLGVALLRLRCLSSLDEGSLLSRLVSLATRPSTSRAATLVAQRHSVHRCKPSVRDRSARPGVSPTDRLWSPRICVVACVRARVVTAGTRCAH